MTRQEPPSREELASLLPSPGEPDLPPGRLPALEEHLMSEMTRSDGEEPPRRRRLVLIAAPLATATLVVGVATVFGTGDGGSAAQPAANSASLERLAEVAAAAPEWEIAADQFIYTAQQVTVDFGGRPTNGQNVIHDVDFGPYENKQWVSPDGGDGWYWDSDAPDGMPIMVPPDPEEVYLDEQERLQNSPPESDESDESDEIDEEELEELEELDSTSELQPEGRLFDDYVAGVGSEAFPASLGQPTWDYVQSLPTDQDELLELIYDTNGSADSGDQADQWAFETLGELFEETPLPSDLAAGTFRAFGDIPGVTVGPGTDAIGREGIVLSRFSENLGYRLELIFDEESADYLGTRVEQVEESEWNPTGILLDSAMTERAVVDEEQQEPGA
ncbi:CU044_5270 family protein [Streptomyces mayteni]